MVEYVRGLKNATKRAAIPIARWLTPEPVDQPIELWGMRTDARGRLLFAGRDVLSLVEEFGSPLQLLDVARLDANLAAFQAPVGTEGRHAELFYSFKTQPVPWIIKRMLTQGAGAEVTSEYELDLAFHLGAVPDSIVYNGPGKSDASLRAAIKAGILLINFNHIEEIHRVAEIARAEGRRARVGVRVVTSAGWASQLGCSIRSGEALAAYERALAMPELEVIGLHSHRGEHIDDAPTLAEFTRELLEFADELRERLGFRPKILDFGGALGVATVRSLSSLDQRVVQTLHTPISSALPAATLTPRHYADQLVRTVEKHFLDRAEPVPRILIEPGRALTGNCQALALRVISTRSASDGIDYAILDGGTSIASILKCELHQLFRVTDFGARPDRHYRLAGPVSHPGDIVAACVSLPRLAAGDVLLVMDSGAYFEPDSTSFSFPRPATVALESGQARVIRRAESFADMIRRDEY